MAWEDVALHSLPLLHFVSHTFLRIGSFFTVGNLAQPLTSLFFFLESDEQSATAHTKLVIARCCGLLRDGFRRKRGECLQTLLRRAAPRRCHDEPIFSFTSILMALSLHMSFTAVKSGYITWKLLPGSYNGAKSYKDWFYMLFTSLIYHQFSIIINLSTMVRHLFLRKVKYT